MNRKYIIAILVILAVFGVWKYFTNNKSSKKIESVKVLKSNLKEVLTLSGQIDADTKATLRFGSSGKIAWINVREGDVVKKWQGLAGLDSADLKAAETKAYYAYLAADANAKEVEDQVKGHDKDESYAQKNDRVAAQTARDTAYDAWYTAQRAVQTASIFSPIDGIVYSAPSLVAGTYITTPTQAEYQIVDPSSLHFSANADQSEVVSLSSLSLGTLSLDAFPDKKFSGNVQRIAYTPNADEVGTVYEVDFKIAGEIPSQIRLGMTGDLSVIINEKSNVLTIPAKFIKSENGKKYVKTNTKVFVETGLETDQGTEIVSGLSEGDVVYD